MRTLAGYEVGAELGKGGMGRVLRVRHLATGIERALKVMDGVSGPEAVARFRREAEALAKASGAGAVPIHESGLERGALWYVMDLMAGGSLRDRLEAAGGRLPWDEAGTLVARVARIVDRCHAMGLIHRDLKPENVLFDDSGTPRLADFGCVRDSGQRSLTEAGELLGTLTYMAPEQLNGLRIDGRADVFALGVILHELVAGERPFDGRTWSELLIAIGEQRRRPLTEIEGVPPALESVANRAMAVDPGARFQSAGELALALELAVKEERIEEEPRSPLRILLPLAAIALGFAGLAASYLIWKSRPPVEGTAPPSSATATSGSWSRTDPVVPPPPPVKRAIDPDRVESARKGVVELAGLINKYQLMNAGGPEKATRAAEKLGDSIGRVSDLDAAAFDELLAPLIPVTRRNVVEGVNGVVGRHLATILFRALGQVAEKTPKELGLAYAIFNASEASKDYGVASERAKLVEEAEPRVSDPVLRIVGLWTTLGCLIQPFEALKANPVARVDTARRLLANDAKAASLMYQVGAGDLEELGPHVRARYEKLRDVHAMLAIHGPEDRQALHREAAMECAESSAAALRLYGGSGGTLPNALRLLMDFARDDPDRIRRFHDLYDVAELRRHPIEGEYLRRIEKDPARALAFTRQRQIGARQAVNAKPDADSLSDLYGLVAVEVNALLDLELGLEATARWNELVAIGARTETGRFDATFQDAVIADRIATYWAALHQPR